MAMPTEPPPVTRPERLAFGIAMMLAGTATLAGAWREVMRHDGGLLAVLPAASMPVFAAPLARRAARRRPS